MKCPTCGATCRFLGNVDFNHTEWWWCSTCRRTWIVVDHLPNDSDPTIRPDASRLPGPIVGRSIAPAHPCQPGGTKRLASAQIGALKKGFSK